MKEDAEEESDDDGTWSTRPQSGSAQLVVDTNISYEKMMETKIKILDHELNELSIEINKVKLRFFQLKKIHMRHQGLVLRLINWWNYYFFKIKCRLFESVNFLSKIQVNFSSRNFTCVNYSS